MPEHFSPSSADSPPPTADPFVRPSWTPREHVWTSRLTAAMPGPTGRLPWGTAALALVAGLVAAVVFPGSAPGIGWLLVALALAAATVPAARAYWRRWDNVGLMLLLVALTGVAAVRDAEWLVAICVLAAVALMPFVLTGARTWLAAALSPLVVPPAVLRLARWGAASVRTSASRPSRRSAWASIPLALLVLVVFLPLLASADPAFARVLSVFVPDLSWLPVQGFVFVLVTGLAAVAAALATFGPRWTDLPDPPSHAVARTTWLVPMVTLIAVFASFLVVQATTLFGGDGYVEQTTGLTYAEYARQGFGQLLVTTVLTLAIVAVAAAMAPTAEPRDRAITRATLAVICGLCLLLVASALHRLGLYEQEFGFTRARMLARTIELYLGAVLALVLAAIAVGKASWLPRAVLAGGAVALLALAAVNPDARVAEHNVERYVATGRIDVGYLAGLSADAVPALLRLDEPVRREVLACQVGRLAERDASWRSANLARARARAVLPGTPVTQCSRAVAPSF